MPTDDGPERIPPVLLTLSQAAQLCGVSERTLWQWAQTGICPPGLRIGAGTVRYCRPAFLQWINSGCRPLDVGAADGAETAGGNGDGQDTQEAVQP